MALEKATFAGGCFWCMEPPFEKVTGVKKVMAGYSGGRTTNPTYDDYAKGGHVEAIEVTYDPKKITYDDLLDIFWRQIDPTDPDGQFVDRGKQYRTAIFYHNDEQKEKAIESKKNLEESKRFNKPIVTEIIAVFPFYPAEKYHQDYAKNHPWKYKWYRSNSGRDPFLQEKWARPVKRKNVRKNS